MSWLKELVKQHEEFESPESFWFWSALAAISAVAKDNIYLDKFLYKLYPNIYVMLHADSGMKKGPPISMAKQLVRYVNDTRIISGRSSIQGILKKLSTAETRPGGHIIKSASAFICSSELTSSIVDDKAALTIFTDLYDRSYNAGEWESLLKMEVFSLKDATVTMLTGTNEAHGSEFFLKKDIQGGYFARTFIVYEKTGQNINSLMYSPKHLIDYEASAQYLKEVAKVKGPIEVSTETRKYFDDWYKTFKRNVIEQKVKDPTGTLNRFDDSVLKVAILISLGSIPEPKITLESVIEAIEHCEKLIGNVRRTTMGSGKSTWAAQKAVVINELLDRSPHLITRQMLNNKYWMQASSSEWDDIMESLEVAGIIKRVTFGGGLAYEMSEEQVKIWYDHLRGK